ELHAAAVAERAKAEDYFAVVFGAGAQGRDLAPRVAAKLGVPLAADATGLEMDGGELVITRPVYAGRAFAKVTLDAQPRLVSVRPNTFRPQESPAAGSVEKIPASSVEPRVKVRETRAAAGAQLAVAGAPAVG